MANGRASGNITADERIRLIQLKLERAKKHFIDLKAEIDTFRSSDPYEIGTKHDPKTRELIYYISRANPFPISFSIITGDVIQNIRSALDHLAYHLVMVGSGGDIKLGERAYFPTATSPDKFENAVRRKVQGMRPDVIVRICQLEPYKGGKGHQFWVLNEINNIDKHRFLINVLTNISSNFANTAFSAFSKETDWLTNEQRDFMAGIFLRHRTARILKEGDVLLRTPHESEVDENFKAMVEIAISEPEVIEAKPILLALQEFGKLVSDTIIAFRPYLS